MYNQLNFQQQQAYQQYVQICQQQAEAQKKLEQEEAERKRIELARKQEEEEKKAKIQKYYSYQTTDERKSLKPKNPPLNIPLVNRVKLEEKMREILKKHNVNMTRESVEIMEIALEMRVKEIVEKLVKISACREETKKNIQTYEISSNPKKIITEIQEVEKAEDEKLQELEKLAEKSREEMDLSKNENAVKSSKLNFDKNEAQSVFSLQQTKKPTLQLPTNGVSLESNQMFLVKEKYLYYCELNKMGTPLSESDRREFIQLHNFLDATHKADAERLQKQQHAELSKPKPQTGISSFLPAGRSTSSTAATILGTQAERPHLFPPAYTIFGKDMKIDKRDFMLFASTDPHLKSKLFYKKTALGIKVAPTVEYTEQSPRTNNHMIIG